MLKWINLCISGVTEYCYSNTNVERINDYKTFELKKLWEFCDTYYEVIEWNKLDAKFYIEFEFLNNEKNSIETFEINYLNYELSKESWNDSIYFIMIDRFIDNQQAELLQNEDFFAGGTFKDILNDLERISQNGYSIVYLSPMMNAFSYHGYNQIDFDTINESFGGEHGLKELISEMKRRKIKFGIELVTNHLSVFSNEFKECLKGNNDLFYITEQCYYENYRDSDDLAKIKFTNRNIKTIYQSIKKLIEDYNIKFIRLDCCDYLESSFVNLLSQYCEENEVILTGECWSSYDNFFNHYSIDGATNYSLYGLMMNLFINKSINVETFQEALIENLFSQGFNKNNCMLNFIDNHDIERISNIVNSVEEIKLLLSFIFMYIGIPVVYYGTENYDDTIKSLMANRRCFFKEQLNNEISNHIKYLNSIRRKFVNDKVYFESKNGLLIFSRDTYEGRVSFIYNHSNEGTFVGEKSIKGYEFIILQ